MSSRPPWDHPGRPEPLERAEEDLEHAVTSLRKLFRERRLSIETMDRPLRVATASAAAMVVATGLFLSLRNVGGGRVSLGGSDSINTPAFVVVLALVAVGFGYVFAASALTASWIALPVLALLLALVGLYTGVFGDVIGGIGYFTHWPAGWIWAARSILVAVLLVAVAVQWMRRRRGAPPTAVGLILLFSVLAGGYLVAIRMAASAGAGATVSYGARMAVIIDWLSLLIVPVLTLAAVDYAEWGELTGHRIATALGSHRTSWRWALGLGAALAMTAYGYRQLAVGRGLTSGEVVTTASRGLAFLAVPGFIVAVGFYLLRMHRRRWPRSLTPASLVAVAAVAVLGMPILTYYLVPSPAVATGTVVATASGQFLPGARVKSVGLPGGASLQLPNNWVSSGSSPNGPSGAASTGPSGSAPAGSGSDTDAGGVLAVTPTDNLLATLFPAGTDLSELEAGFRLPPGRATQRLGALSGVPFSGGYLWTAPGPAGGMYVLYETTRHPAADDPVLRAVAGSFRAPGQPPAPAPRSTQDVQAAAQDHRFALQIAIDLALAVLAVAVGVIDRRWRPQLVGAGLLLGAVGLFNAVFAARALGDYVLGTGANLPHLQSQDQLAVGAGGLGVLALVLAGVVARQRPRLARQIVGGIIGLEGALAALELMYWLYGKSISASRVSIWAAVILLVAMLWDITMSGDTFTNENTPHVPRAARVVGYFGYVIVLTAVILFFSAEHVVGSGPAADPLFDSDNVTQAALFGFALPLVVLLFLIRTGPQPLNAPAVAPLPPVPSDEAVAEPATLTPAS